jgi:hypothetical protein
MPGFPGSYATWIAANYAYLEAEKLCPKGKAPRLSLPEIFIPLYAADPIQKEEPLQEEQTNEKQAWALKQKHEKSPQIEQLAARHHALLVEGQAGSGKSTVLKHLAYVLSPATEAQPAFEGLNGYLPVLIQLKDSKTTPYWRKA